MAYNYRSNSYRHHTNANANNNNYREHSPIPNRSMNMNNKKKSIPLPSALTSPLTSPSSPSPPSLSEQLPQLQQLSTTNLSISDSDSTLALGHSPSSLEFDDYGYHLHEKVDLITTTFGRSPPILPLREERLSLGVETVFKARGVGWQGVRKKYKLELMEQEKLEKQRGFGLGLGLGLGLGSFRRSNGSKSSIGTRSAGCGSHNNGAADGHGNGHGSFHCLTFSSWNTCGGFNDNGSNSGSCSSRILSCITFDHENTSTIKVRTEHAIRRHQGYDYGSDHGYGYGYGHDPRVRSIRGGLSASFENEFHFSSSRKKNTTTTTSGNDRMKALTYDEYLEYLKRCRDKMRDRGTMNGYQNSDWDYLELELPDEKEEEQQQQQQQQEREHKVAVAQNVSAAQELEEQDKDKDRGTERRKKRLFTREISEMEMEMMDVRDDDANRYLAVSGSFGEGGDENDQCQNQHQTRQETRQEGRDDIPSNSCSVNAESILSEGESSQSDHEGDDGIDDGIDDDNECNDEKEDNPSTKVVPVPASKRVSFSGINHVVTIPSRQKQKLQQKEQQRQQQHRQQDQLKQKELELELESQRDQQQSLNTLEKPKSQNDSNVTTTTRENGINELLQDVNVIVERMQQQQQQQQKQQQPNRPPRIMSKPSNEKTTITSPTTTTDDDDDNVSPRTKMNICRGTNLLDTIYATKPKHNQETKAKVKINKDNSEFEEVDMLKRALTDVHSKNKVSSVTVAGKKPETKPKMSISPKSDGHEDDVDVGESVSKKIISPQVSPLGASAAADLARALLSDIQNIKSASPTTNTSRETENNSFQLKGTGVNKYTRPTFDFMSPLPDPRTSKGSTDILRVSSDLREEQANRKLEAIGLAKMILDEARVSLNQEESIDASDDNNDDAPSAVLAKSIMAEINSGNISPIKVQDRKVLSPSPTPTSLASPAFSPEAYSPAQDIMKVDSDLREEQAKRHRDSIGLANMILDEVRLSLEEEEASIARSLSMDSAESIPSSPVLLARSIMMEVNSGNISPVKLEGMKVETPLTLLSPQSSTDSADDDIMKVGSELLEEQTQRQLESIGLAKSILNEVRHSLEKEEAEVIILSKSFSADSAELATPVRLARSIMEEVNSGNISPVKLEDMKDVISVPMLSPQSSTDSVHDIMKVGSDLRQEQTHRQLESIGLAKLILDEVRSSLDQEEAEVIMLSKSLSVESAESIPPSPVRLARSIMTEVNSGSISPVNLTEMKEAPPLPILSKSSDSVLNIMKVDSGLREEQTQRQNESIGLAKSILHEVFESSDQEEAACTKSASTESAELALPVLLARSIMKELNSGKLSPLPPAQKKEAHFVSIPSPPSEESVHDIMKVDSDLRQNQTKRQAESVDLAKAILEEVRPSVDDEQYKIPMPSSSSFELPSKSYARLSVDDDSTSELSMRRRSSISWGQTEVRSIANLNHPAELAQRRADDIRARHMATTTLTRSASQDTEDSWSQPNTVAGLRKDCPNSWIEENESLSISSTEKSVSSSAELARRLIEEARTRHARFSSNRKPDSPSNVCDEERSESSASSFSGKKVDEITFEDGSHSSTTTFSTITERTVKVGEEEEREREEEEEGDGKGEGLTVALEEKTFPIRNNELKVSIFSGKKERIAQIQSKHESPESQGIEVSLKPAESVESCGSSFSDDSIDENQDIKRSTDLARRLIQNAKMRHQKVSDSPPRLRGNPEEGNGSESLNESSELAKRLLFEAFDQHKGASSSESETLSALQKDRIDDEFCDDHDDDVSRYTHEISRQIMNDAGFSDLLKSSSSSSGSFDRFMQAIGSLGFERTKLEAIEERDDRNSRQRAIRDLSSSPVEEGSDQSQTIGGTMKKALPPRSAFSTKKKPSVKTTPKQRSHTRLCHSQDAASPSPAVSQSCASSPTINSEGSFHTCPSSPSKLKTDETPIRSNKSSRPQGAHGSKEIYHGENQLLQTDASLQCSATIVEKSSVNKDSSPTNTKAIGNDDDSDNNSDFDEVKYTIPQSFSMTSCHSSSTNGFSIKSSKSIDDVTAQFEIEDSISFTVNELNKINSMLEDAESSCHSSKYADEKDVLFFAKQSKQEIAALAKTIENRMNAEQINFFARSTSTDKSYAETSIGESSSVLGCLKSPASSSSKRERVSKSQAMDQLIEEVNDLCNQIETRVDNIVSDTQQE